MAATKKQLGFFARCPFCGDAGAELVICLSDLECIRCEGCGEEFSPQTAQIHAAVQLAEWDRIARFVEAGRKIREEK